MNLLLVRHAQSEGNATGQYSTAVSDSLSRQGETQALSLVEDLSSWSFDKIIVSPRQRAMQTITPYLMATHQKAEIWPEVAEACWHDEREAVADSWRSAPDPLPDSALPIFSHRNGEAIRPAHPESFGEGLRRVHAALELVRGMAGEPIECVLMVTHGHVIREALNLMLDTNETAHFPHDNCGITLMSFNEAWTMQFCNRTPRESIGELNR